MFQQIYQTALPLDDKKRENMDFIKNGKEMYIKEKAEANVVQFVTKYFDEIIDAFYTDLDSQKYIFNIHNLGENICKVQFDYRNMPHLLGMNAAGYSTKKMAEESKVAVRAIRREGIDKAKVMQKDGELTEDDLRSAEDNIQKLTDKKIDEIDKVLADKEKEILTV